MKEPTVILTREMIFACQTPKHAWTKASLEALGQEWMKLRPGWIQELVGKEIPAAQFDRAMAGKEIDAKALRCEKREQRAKMQLTLL